MSHQQEIEGGYFFGAPCTFYTDICYFLLSASAIIYKVECLDVCI